MISVTESAAKRIKLFLENRGKGLGIRLGVTTSGCSGMAYVLEFVDDKEIEDTLYEIKGVKIIIDPKSLIYLNGINLDFVKDGINEGFKFDNPNATGECGCGESFTV